MLDLLGGYACVNLVKLSLMMYKYPPELCSRCKKSIDTNPKGGEVVIPVSGAWVLKLGRRCLRPGQGLVTR